MVRLTLNGSPARTNDDNSANCTAPGHRDYNYRPIVNRLLLLLPPPPPPPPLLLLLGALLLLLVLVNDAADWDEDGQRRCTDLPPTPLRKRSAQFRINYSHSLLSYRIMCQPLQ